MDNSTLLFIATLVGAFLFLRWLISPIPQSVPEEFDIPDPARRHERVHTTTRRPVNDSMIEVVHAIAPQLTLDQIRRSLEQTGSVEATIEQYMENGTLLGAVAEEDHSTPAPVSTQSLLEKYNVDENAEIESTEATWGKDKDERVRLLQKRREEMILRARRSVQALDS